MEWAFSYRGLQRLKRYCGLNICCCSNMSACIAYSLNISCCRTSQILIMGLPYWHSFFKYLPIYFCHFAGVPNKIRVANGWAKDKLKIFSYPGIRSMLYHHMNYIILIRMDKGL